MNGNSAQRLGFYTVEQEADEVSIEKTAEVGVDPKDYPIDYLAIHQAFYAERAQMRGELEMVRGALPSETCAKFLKAGFKTERGNFQYIPVADYVDVHHASCFRAFNAYREVEQHKFQGPFTPLNDAEYQALKKQLLADGLISEKRMGAAAPYRTGGTLNLRAW